jgi:DNA-directed RNA polymerase subunit RPC12/RpoP
MTMQRADLTHASWRFVVSDEVWLVKFGPSYAGTVHSGEELATKFAYELNQHADTLVHQRFEMSTIGQMRYRQLLDSCLAIAMDYEKLVTPERLQLIEAIELDVCRHGFNIGPAQILERLRSDAVFGYDTEGWAGALMDEFIRGHYLAMVKPTEEFDLERYGIVAKHKCIKCGHEGLGVKRPDYRCSHCGSRGVQTVQFKTVKAMERELRPRRER